MGLEDFKTEGPRTYSEGSRSNPESASNSGNHDEIAVHVLRDIDRDEIDTPSGVKVHKLVKRVGEDALINPSKDVEYSCLECTRYTHDFDTLVKVIKTDLLLEWFDVDVVNEHTVLELYGAELDERQKKVFDAIDRACDLNKQHDDSASVQSLGDDGQSSDSEQDDGDDSGISIGSDSEASGLDAFRT